MIKNNILPLLASILISVLGASSSVAANQKILPINPAITNSRSVRIESEQFVYDPQKIYLQTFLANPSVIVDHVSREGYEVYGPSSLGRDLSIMGISHSDLMSDSWITSADYPRFEEVKAQLLALEKKYSGFMRLYSVGESVQGRELMVMKISDNPDADEVEPEFKYISSMHGDEITGRELMLRLIDDLGKAYLAGDRSVSDLVNNTEIYIMPSMNPDGSELRQRANARGYDLNRNFPELSGQALYGQSNANPTVEIETKALMDFQASRQFSLSANFHGGAEVVNYPWDAIKERHPLDRLVYNMSVEYAKLAPYIGASAEFASGVTNGFDWYQVLGGMQDWSYRKFNDLQLTVELSDRKWPNFNDLGFFYQQNYPALVTFIGKVHQGAGFKYRNPGVNGTVSIIDAQGQNLGSFAFRNSEFYKVLPQGDYRFDIQAQGSAENASITVKVSENRIAQDNGNYTTIGLR